MRSSTLKRHVVEYHSQTSTTRSKQERERASSTRRGQHIPMAHPAGTLALFDTYTHAHLRIPKYQWERARDRDIHVTLRYAFL